MAGDNVCGCGGGLCWGDVDIDDVGGIMKQIKNNVWQTPVNKNYKLVCCDCGLVHETDFRIFKGRIQFRVRRKN
jgi:hypothetical protein